MIELINNVLCGFIYIILTVLSNRIPGKHFCAMAEEDFEQLNKDVSDWAKFQSQRLRRLVGALTLKDRHAVQKAIRAAIRSNQYKPLKTSIGSALRKESGQVNRINFRFSKQGIWLEHGVGRGRPVRSAAANPKPWLKPVLDPALDILANLISDNYADIAAGEIKFFIPGITDRRIKINNG